ncbi:MAG: T9SS C-terminal target domain-containing protein, partial [Ignavibacteria bacterium]
SIDVVDLTGFVKSWSSPDSIYGADLYPYDGEIPYVEVNGNFELDINDLLTFVDQWYYDKINVSLPKIAGNNSVQADERKEIRFRRGEKKFEFPIHFDKNDLKAFSATLKYDNSIFDIDSVYLNGKSISDEDINLIYTDSASGIIYCDFAKLKGKLNGDFTLSASVNSNLDKFNPKDSLILELKGINDKSETSLSKTIVYSMTEIPKDYNLSQNYPNPFNPTTTIEFDLPEPGRVHLVLYNILGQKVATLINDIRKEGSYRYLLDASKINGGLASGVYIYRFVANKFVSTKKLVLLK